MVGMETAHHIMLYEIVREAWYDCRVQVRCKQQRRLFEEAHLLLLLFLLVSQVSATGTRRLVITRKSRA